MQDIFSFEELRDFDTRVRKVAEENNEELKYVVETKIDGLSTALKYENGILVQKCNQRKWTNWRRCNRKSKNN